MENKRFATLSRTFMILCQLVMIQFTWSKSLDLESYPNEQETMGQYTPIQSPASANQFVDPHPSVSLTITDIEKEKLSHIYGQEVINEHQEDFETAQSIGMQEGADEHAIPWNGHDEDSQSSLVDDALLDAVNSVGFPGHSFAKNSSMIPGERSSLDTETVKSLLKDLLERLDTLKQEDTHGVQDFIPINSGQEQQHCTVHGLWLSSVAGAAIELIPLEVEGGRIEIQTRIYDLPERPEKSLITSGWSGKGMISPESPTTLTIVFQEHLLETSDQRTGGNPDENFKLPKTAVFVGQCLVCQRSPVLQGTWVVFPSTQSCMITSPGEKVPPPLSPDTFLQLTA